MSLFSSATNSMSPSGDLGPARITSSRRQTSDVSWSKPATEPNLRMASNATRRPQPRLKWTREGLALVSPRRGAAPLPTDAVAATRQRFVGRRPQTRIHLTENGRKAWLAWLDRMQALMRAAE